MKTLNIINLYYSNYCLYEEVEQIVENKSERFTKLGLFFLVELGCWRLYVREKKRKE